jgi:hypothetical protein
VAKTCPHCGYTSIGPFVDNCPICAEPVRNVRSDGVGSFRAPRLWSVLGWVGVGLGVVLVSVLGCCGVGMWNLNAALRNAQQAVQQAAEKEAAERQARTVVVTAADLLQEFGKDPDAGDRKYAGKYLELSGVVEGSGRGRHERPFLILTGDREGEKLKIECFFDYAGPQDEADIKRLDKGQSVTVHGEYDGRVSNVQVRNCQLVQAPERVPGRPPRGRNRQ